MTNEELKKKICDIIAPYVAAYGEDEAIANALIAAGIGDVGKYKEKLKLHRVFISKDGGDIKVLYGNNEIDEIVKERNEYKHRAEVAERAGKIAASKVFDYAYEEAVAQAEKELTEERKDE